MFIRTDTILDKILAHKADEVVAAKAALPTEAARAAAEAQPQPRDFLGALRRETVALIAEVKKASPSKGVLIEDFDAVRLATTYAENGAAALSVLTDNKFFQGHLDDLSAVRAVMELPVLRKDFILDTYQLYEARAAGADAVLLIAMALDDALLADLQALIYELGMAALVEVHHETELERALRLGSRLIGVNNRDLRTFHEDITITQRLARLVPPDVMLVAESAVRTESDVRLMGEWGAHAVLVGEGLLKSADIGEQVRRFSGQMRRERP